VNNAKFQQQLEEMYNKYSFIAKHTQKTLNELVYVLRMSGENYQLNVEHNGSFFAIPGVIDCFIPVKTLAQKVVNVEFDEETYSDFGIKLLLIEMED
jgi:hypothetical protein